MLGVYHFEEEHIPYASWCDELERRIEELRRSAEGSLGHAQVRLEAAQNDLRGAPYLRGRAEAQIETLTYVAASLRAMVEEEQFASEPLTLEDRTPDPR